MTYMYSKSEDAEVWEHTKLDDLVREIVQEQDIEEDSVLYLYRGKVKKQRVGTFAPNIVNFLEDCVYDTHLDDEYAEEWIKTIPEKELQKDFEIFINNWFKRNKLEPNIEHVVEIEPITVGVAMSPKITAIMLPSLDGK